MLHHGSEDYDPSLSFCTVPGFAEDLGFWKCRGTRRFMHNDAPDAATLDWVDWRWIFMQVITCSSLSDSFCAREPGPKSMLLTTPKPAGGLQGCLKQGSVRKRVSYGILCASLDREVRAGTVCAVTWRSPPRILELVEFRAFWRALRRYGDEGADQTVRPGGLVRPLSWGWTWIWTRATDCLVSVRPIYQPQTSMAGPL